MKRKEINVSADRTINIGNYNSRKYGLWVTAELEEGDDFHQCYQELLDDLEAKLDDLEYKAKNPAKPVPPAPLLPQQPQNGHGAYTEEPRTQAQREIVSLLTNIPRSSRPELSEQITNRLAATLQRRGWQGLDDVKYVAGLLLNRAIEEVWDVREHEAKAIIMWLDKAPDSQLDVLWPPTPPAS